MPASLAWLMVVAVVWTAACAPAARPAPGGTSPSGAAPAPAAAGAASTPTAVAPERSASAIEEFYRGKTIRVIVGFSAGGGFDVLARLVARHLGKHVPGNPTIVVENMSGAAGKVAANYLYGSAPKNGLVIGVFPEPSLQSQLVGADGVQFDARHYNWLGSTQAQSMLCVARADSGVASLDDVIRGGKSLIVGTTGPGSNIHDFPAVLKDALNVNFRLVPGYPGAADITLALQRNEVGGVCRPWESIRATNPDWLTSSPPYVVPLVQQGAERDPELPNVPLAEELVQTQEQRQLIRAAGSTLSIAKPFVAPPGVPAERVAALRQAFEATMHDPELLREADTAKIDLSFKTAERVQAIVNEVLDTPPGVVQRLKAATEGGS